MRKLKLFSLLMLLFVGVTSMWGLTYSMTPDATTTGSDATSYQASLSFKYEGVSWTMVQINPSTLQTKTNQTNPTAEFNFHNTSAFPGRITKVVVTYSALTVATGKASEFKFLGGTSEVTATTGGDAATWNSTNKTMTWTPAANTNYTYFAFYMNGKTATGSNYLAESNAIVVTYEAPKPTVSLTPKSLAFGNVLFNSSPDPKIFAISGSNLTKDDVTITAPTGFQVAEWAETPSYNTSVTLTPSAGAISSTDIVVKPVTSATGTFDGNITISGGGLTADSTVAVTMTVVGPEASASVSSLSWGSKKQYAESEEHTNYLPLTFTVSGVRLTGNVNISITQDQLGDHFSRYPVSLSPTDGVIDEATVTVYGSTLAAGEWTGKVTLSSATSDFADIDIPLSLTVTPTYEVAVALAVLDKEDNPVAAEDIPDGITATISGGVSGSSTSQYTDGDETLTVTATTIAGYDFTGWTVSSEDLEVASASALTSEVTTIAAGTITAHFKESATPTLLASKSALDFGEVDINSEPEGLTFTLTGANLTEDVSLLTGNENEAFTLSKTSLTKEEVMAEGGVTITVTPKPTYAGTITNKIYANWEQGMPKIVDLSMTVNKLAAGLAWSAAAATVTTGEATADDFPTLTNPNSLAITYSSTEESVATISNEAGHKGEITLLAAGTTTIKATTEGNDTYAAQVVEYELTVQEKKTVEWWINGAKKGSQTALEGTELTGIPDATLASNGAIYGKVFKGWAEAEIEDEVAEGAAGIVATPTVMPNEDKKYYAVYATEVPGEASLTKLGSSYAPAAGDNLVIVAVVDEDNEYALYQETTSSSYVKYWAFDNDVANLAADAKKYVTLESATDGKFYLGDATNGYVYSSGSNNLSVDASNKTAWTLAWNNTDKAFTFNQGRYLSCRSDLAGSNQYLFRLAGSTPAGTYKFDLYQYALGTTTYTKYATSGPKLLDDPTFSPAAGTYTEAKSVAISAGEGETIYYTINGEDPTTSSDEYTTAISLSKYGEYTIKAIAAKEDGSKSNVASATYKINVPFESVDELLGYVESKTPFGNVQVTGIVSEIVTPYGDGGYENITFNISDDGQTTSGHQLQSFRGVGTDADKIGVGDKVTITGTYTVYGSTKELAQGNVISNRIAAAVTSVEIGGDADTKAYENGEAFAFTGLTATAVYNTGYEKDVTEEANVWAADPATIGASTESVSVTATYDEVASTPKVVTGITVNKHAVTFSAPANGTLVIKNGETPISSGNTFVKNTVLTIEAEPASALYELATLTAGGVDIKASKEFTIGTADVAVVATYALKPFASLEALVAANLDMSVDQEVTVSFSDVEITEIKTGEIFLNVKDENEKNISIYVGEPDVPTGWSVGGKVSGTAIVGLWVYDDDEYYWLMPNNDWTGITYKAPSGLAWSDAEATAYTVGKSYSLPTLTNPNSLTVAYSSSNTDAATINAETGAISIVAAGTTTITATFAGNDDYIAKEVSYELTVVDVKKVVVTGTPKTAYDYDESFSFTGLGAKAIYTNDEEYEIPGTGLSSWTATPTRITENGKVQVTVTWATRTSEIREFDVTVIPNFYITGTAVGATEPWDPALVPVIGATSYTIDDLEPGSYSLKITTDGTWSTVKGFDDLTPSEMVAGLYRGTGEDTNIYFTLKETSDVTVTYDGEIFKLAGNFLPQTVSVKGAWDSWAAHEMTLSLDKKSASVSFNITAAENVEFGVQINTDEYRANGASFDRSHTSETGITGNTGNMKLTSDKTDTYTFTWTFGTNALSITFPEQGGGTALDNAEAQEKAVKFIENNQIFIRRGDKTFNAQGQLVK